jgi:hypothetical protein
MLQPTIYIPSPLTKLLAVSRGAGGTRTCTGSYEALVGTIARKRGALRKSAAATR